MADGLIRLCWYYSIEVDIILSILLKAFIWTYWLKILWQLSSFCTSSKNVQKTKNTILIIITLQILETFLSPHLYQNILLLKFGIKLSQNQRLKRQKQQCTPWKWHDFVANKTVKVFIEERKVSQVASMLPLELS